MEIMVGYSLSGCIFQFLADGKDMVIITNGTLLSIQNMTWNGKLGFQAKPSKSFRIDLPDLQYQTVFEANGLNATTQGELGITVSYPL